MAKANVIAAIKSDEDRWRAESDLRTLIEARKIRDDKKRLAAARAVAKEQTMATAAVAADGAGSNA